MTKNEARKIFRQRRTAMTAPEIERMNDLILLQFQKLSLPFLDCVHAYIPSERLVEPDTSLILRYLLFRYPGLKIAAPKIDVKALTMLHYHITDFERLEQNIYGIDEPVSGVLIEPHDIDLAIIPLLAFDLNGNRVGYGKGYYDRFLADCRSDMIKVGLSFFEPVDAIADIDTLDIQLDYCCTPDQIYNW